jgi:hypothetical protein
MKRSITIITLISVIAIIVAQSLNQKIFSNRAGAPAGRTGSPFDNGGVACNVSGCHSGSTVINPTGWITSNIPGTGYIPGNTYTISTAATLTSCVRFGFEISPQTTTGALAGTNIITDAVNTRFSSSNPKYVTHTSTGSNAMSTPGTKSWSFNWTAPAGGTGTVTFYGAFNCANNNNSSTGDQIYLSTLTVPEDVSVSWVKPENNSYAFDVFPNPASGTINISVNAIHPMIYHVRLMDVSGKEVRGFETAEVSGNISQKTSLSLDGVNPGIYFLQIVSEGSVATKKIAVL